MRRWLRRRAEARRQAEATAWARERAQDLTYAREAWRSWAPAQAEAVEARIRCGGCRGRHASVAEVRACSGDDQTDAARDFERVFGYRQAAAPPF